MKKILSVYSSPRQHWVGDGFPVRSLFSYDRLGRELSPFLLLDYAGCGLSDGLFADQTLLDWRGDVLDSYPQMALMSTMALALRGLGQNREQAFESAEKYWAVRDKSI